MTLAADDPRLTAYALGELNADEAAAVEAELLRRPDLRAEVAQARRVAETLERELAAEEAPALTDIQRAQIEAEMAAAGPRRRTSRAWPWWAGAVAAVLLIGYAAAAWNVLGWFAPGTDRGAEVAGTSNAPAAQDLPYSPPPVAGTPRPADLDGDGAWATVGAGGGCNVENPFVPTREQAVSHLPVRVEDADYLRIREMILEQRRLPGPGAILRIEQMINHFPYAYAPASGGGHPFSLRLHAAECPWAAGHRLLRLAVQAGPGDGRLAARDARVRVRFDPDAVAAWRLIGFENRRAAIEPAATEPPGADLPAGSAVTALYELVPAAGAAGRPCGAAAVSYRPVGAGGPREDRLAIPAGARPLSAADDDFRFAAAVAAFGMILRDSEYRGGFTLADAAELAAGAVAADPAGHRRDFLRLIAAARELSRRSGAPGE